MALGDGITWDESVPVDGTNATQIDDYNRDLRKGVRNRMALEHEWPSSQSATSEAGKHKFITFQEQGTKPTLSGTQKAAIYAKTNHNLYYENSAGVETAIIVGTAVPGNSVTASSGLSLALVGTQFPASTALLGNNIAISSGQVVHAATIPILSGYSRAQCKHFVSVGNSLAASGTGNPDGIAYNVSVNEANGVVTAVWDSINAGGGSGTCTANFLIIGVQ